MKKADGIHSSPSFMLLLMCGINGVIAVGHGLSFKVAPVLSLPYLGFMLVASLLCYFASYFQISAVSNAPNPGYALAMISCSSVLVAVLSIFLFGAEITLLKACGILLSVAGVLILVL